MFVISEKRDRNDVLKLNLVLNFWFQSQKSNNIAMVYRVYYIKTPLIPHFSLK